VKGNHTVQCYLVCFLILCLCVSTDSTASVRRNKNTAQAEQKNNYCMSWLDRNPLTRPKRFTQLITFISNRNITFTVLIGASFLRLAK